MESCCGQVGFVRGRRHDEVMDSNKRMLLQELPAACDGKEGFDWRFCPEELHRMQLGS